MHTEDKNTILESISIQGIKGIGKEKIFKFNDFRPNKPSILVAPNGFGKSSFAIAFNSFNTKGIRLEKKDIHIEQEEIKPQIKIKLHGQAECVIDETKNECSKDFSFYVINNTLYAKIKRQKINNKDISTASLEVKTIEIIKNIPEKIDLKKLNKETLKIDFPKSSNILYLLQKNDLFIKLEEENIDLNKFNKKSIYLNHINKIKDKLNNYEESYSTELLKILDNIECLKQLKTIVSRYCDNESEILIYIKSIKLASIFKNKLYKKFVERCKYDKNKEKLNELIQSFDTTSCNLKLKEKDNNLVFEFPHATRISNGQRDILNFIVKLFKAQLELTKTNNFLIIDEIFDCLDDANLIAFQYYISVYIQYCKNHNKNLYCILLTHLDPKYFKTYLLKYHIEYLNETKPDQNNDVYKLISFRDLQQNDDMKDDQNIDKYLFHFSEKNKTICCNNKNINNQEWYQTLFKEVNDKYLKIKKYDPLKICFAIRIKIEQLAYQKLKEEQDQNIFLEKLKETNDKLNLLDEKGICYPEIYSLLGIIHNPNLHHKTINEAQLKSKLSNLAIRKMIETIFPKDEDNKE